MKRFFIIFSLLFLTSNAVWAVEQTATVDKSTSSVETKTSTSQVKETTDTLTVFSTDNKFFGLKNKNGDIIVNPI